MATDFWASSHYNRWIVNRATLKEARAEDAQYVHNEEELDFLAIYFANIITRLGKKLQLRQRVIATATVFFRRFYLRNAYCETEPFLVISACIYAAAKAEESPVHIKNVVSESRSLFSHHYGVKNFPTDNVKLAEMEFYLISDLNSDLIVYHPYRTLLALCKSVSGDEEEGEEGEEEEAGEVGAGINDGARYWGTGEGKLCLSKEAFQIAWSIINDTYRSELCLLYPPHLIAIAAIYLTFILHPPAEPQAQPRRSSRQAKSPSKNPDPITFLSQLNVSLPLVATISQEIISLYTMWERYKEDGAADAPVSTLSKGKKTGRGVHIITAPNDGPVPIPVGESTVVTTAMLSTLLSQMREARLIDLILGGEGDLLGIPASEMAAPSTQHYSNQRHGSMMQGMNANLNQQQYAINKMLERTMYR